MLKVLNGIRFAADTDTHDLYLIDSTGKATKLTDGLVLTDIEITAAPTKTSYVEGQTFDPAGMVVKATYSSGLEVEISGYSVSLAGALATTDTKVTVSYSESGITKTDEQAITVVAKAVDSIAVTTPPTKTAYTVDETFDPAGMVVTATYNDETTAEVTDYTYEPTAALATTDTAVTITYETKTTTQAITVA